MATTEMNMFGGVGGKAMLLFSNYGSVGGSIYFADGSGNSKKEIFPYIGSYTFENAYVKIDKPSQYTTSSDSITYKKAALHYEPSSGNPNYQGIVNAFKGAGTSKSAGTVDTGTLYERCFVITWDIDEPS